MIKIYIFVCFLFFTLKTSSQIRTEKVLPKSKISVLSIESFSYPTFMSGEQHSHFNIDYNLDKKFSAELQGFYDTYLLSDVVRFELRSKYYLGSKLYLFSGIASESEINIYSGKISPPRFLLINGAGLNVTKGLELEARHEFQINNAGLGNYGLPNLFSVQGKYKF